MRDVLLISRAWHFAAQRHATQRRKGKANEPYVNHRIPPPKAVLFEGREGCRS